MKKTTSLILKSFLSNENNSLFIFSIVPTMKKQKSGFKQNLFIS